MPIIAAGYHTLDSISTNDPRPRWDVSVRLILESFESGSFSNENKRRISKTSSPMSNPSTSLGTWSQAMSVVIYIKKETPD